MMASESGNTATARLNPDTERNQGRLGQHWCSSRVVTLGWHSWGVTSTTPCHESCKASLCPALPSKIPGCWTRFGCFWCTRHFWSIRHSHTPLLLAHHPFPVAWWMDGMTGKQGCQWSCSACIYTLGSSSISVLYVSLFRWCVNSLYTFFFPSESCSECLCICIVLYFSSCSQIFIKIFP